MVPYVLDTIEVLNTLRRADARIIMLSQLGQNLLRAKFDIIIIIHDIEKIRTDGHGRDVQQTTLSLVSVADLYTEDSRSVYKVCMLSR